MKRKYENSSRKRDVATMSDLLLLEEFLAELLREYNIRNEEIMSCL
jgi:hypothetical protein